MDEHLKSNIAVKRKIKDSNYDEGNQKIENFNEININNAKTKIRKIILKEKEEKFIFHNDKNQNRKKTILNNLSESQIQSYYKIKYKKLYFLLNLIVSFINICFFSCENSNEKILSKLSEVSLMINGNGNIKLFSDEFLRKYNHCDIYVNDIFFDKKINEYFIDSNLNYSENISLTFVKIVWNDTILTTRNMFENCYKIIEMDLSKFDASNVNDMSRMFYNCYSLISLNLSGLDTPKLNNMEYMFFNCSSLISLDLSNFNTSNLQNLSYIFSQCSSLISLDLTNFDTSKIRDMSYMFNRCSSLISLNLSNFNTSLVTNMRYMFYNCSS